MKLCVGFLEMGKIQVRKCGVASFITDLCLYVVSQCPESGIKSAKASTVLLSV